MKNNNFSRSNKGFANRSKNRPKLARVLEFEPLEPRILFAADPVATVENLPQEEMVNEEVSFDIEFDNVGTDTGYKPYVDFTAPPEMQITNIEVYGVAGENENGSSLVPIGEISATGELVAVGTSTPIDHPAYIGNPAGSFGTLGSGTAPVQYDVGTNPDLVGMYVYSVDLPFGSYSEDNPPVSVNVTGRLDTINATTPTIGVVPNNEFSIFAQGGFAYGEDALNNPLTDTPLVGALDQSEIEPLVVNLVKTANVREEDGAYTGESASGPNHPITYTLAVDVATTETITNFDIVDTLPDDLAYLGNLEVRNGSGVLLTAGVDYTLNSEPNITTDGISAVNAATNTLSITMIGGVTGVAGDDVVVTYDTFVPYVESDGSTLVIDPISGDENDLDPAEYNDASVNGDYDHPLASIPTVGVSDDDGPMNPADTDGETDYRIEEHSIAIQKSVEIAVDNNVTGASPFDVLEYTMDFQISDYFAVDNLIVTDTLGDGQDFLFGTTNGAIIPTLTFQMQGSMIAVDFDLSNVISTLDPLTGETVITFDVYQQLIDSGFVPANGGGTGTGGVLQTGDALLGGMIPVGGLGLAAMGSFNSGTPTLGTLTFRAGIRDSYTDTGAGEQEISQGDTLGNDTVIDARNLDVNDLSVIGAIETDGSSAGVTIAVGDINKAVYSVTNRAGVTTLIPGGTDPVNIQLAVGDIITYVITYDLPLSEFENFVMDDFLPQPIFDSASIDTGGVYAFDASTYTTAGRISYGLGDTFFGTQGAAGGDGGITDVGAYTAPSDPTIDIATFAASNGIRIDVGDYQVGTLDPVATTIQFLISVEVMDGIFEDGLLFTNQVGATESNTTVEPSDTEAIAGSQLTAPNLTITKGVIATTDTSGNFTATPGPAGVTFNAPGSAAAFSGVINSDGLATTPIDSNITNLDAGDVVTFAVVIENLGSSTYGAFDIVAADTIPAGFVLSGVGGNLRVTDGNGVALVFGVDYTGDLFAGTFELIDTPAAVGVPAQGALTEYDGTSGTNLVVIAYDLILEDDIQPNETLTNTATLTNYSNGEGNIDYTPTDLTDTAFARTRNVTVDKTVIDTSYDDTNNLDSSNQVAIGEVVTYQVVITIPEGEMGDFDFTDTLDEGMAFLDLISVVATGNLTTSVGVGDFSDVMAVISGGAVGSVTQDNILQLGFGGTAGLGTVTNLPSTPQLQTETITVTYRAVVLNAPNSDRGDLLGNDAEVSWDVNGAAAGGERSVSDSEDVLVVEPNISINKVVSASTAEGADILTYTITVTNNAGANVSEAFEVELDDVLPTEISYQAGTLSFVSGIAPDLGTLLFNPGGGPEGSITATFARLGVGESSVISFDVRVDDALAIGTMVTNQAEVDYTSLPDTETETDIIPGGHLFDSERTGDTADEGGSANDYVTNNPASFTILSPTGDKVIIDTAEGSTGEDDSASGTVNGAIGEVVRYELVIEVPQATSTAVVIVDTLDPALFWLMAADNNITISFNGFDTAPTLAGDLMAGVGSTITLDPSRVSVIGNVVSFDLGDIVNNDTDSTPETLTLAYNVIVGNGTGAGLASAGDVLTNSAQMTVAGSNVGAAMEVDLTVVEPSVAITKSDSGTTTADAGDIITYTMVVTAASGANNTTAFDLQVLDSVPDELAIVFGSLAIAGLPGYATIVTNTVVGQDITVVVDELRVGDSYTITFQAMVRDTGVDQIRAGETVTNTTNLTYSSLPGDGTDNGVGENTTGSEAQPTADTPGAERTYTGSANDSFTAPEPSISKVFDPTQPGAPLGTNPTNTATIGEEINYLLTITVPEGMTGAPEAYVLDTVAAGLSYVAGSLSITLGTGVTIGTAGALDDTNAALFTLTDTGATNDETLQFDFTSIDFNNGGAGNGLATQTIQIRYTLKVDNIIGNQAAVVLDNNADLFYSDGDNPGTTNQLQDSTGDADTNVTIVEPNVTPAKTITSVVPASPDAGDVIGYQVVLTSNGDVSAFDILFEDTLPTGLSLSTGTFVVTGTGLAAGVTAADFTVTATGVTLTATGVDLAVGDTITITYDAVIQDTVTDGQSLLNNAGVEWTSLDGTVTGERTGDGDPTNNPVPGALNNYENASTAEVVVNLVQGLTKEIISTSSPHTTGSNLAIGEEVTYRLVVSMAEGTTNQVVLSDVLDLANGTLDMRTVTIVSFGSNLSVSGAAVGSAVSINDVSGYGNNFSIDFGSVVNNAATSVPANAQIIVEVTAVVVNVIENQGGDVINNVATLAFLSDTDGDGNADDPDSLTDNATISIVEADVEVAKTTTSVPTTPEAGETVAYQVVINNSGAVDAFDLTFSDVLPAEMDLQLGTFTATLSAGSVDVSAFFTVTTGSIVNVAGGFDLVAGATITITYDALILPTVTDGLNLTNNVDIEWTSLDGTDPDERTGDGDFNSSTDPLNNYEDESSATVVVDLNPIYAFTKEIIATSAAHTGMAGGTDASITDLAIGEEVTYRLTATMANGTTNAVNISDVMALANGILDIRSVSIVSVGSNLTTTGANAGDVVTIVDVASYGNSFSVDFGTVVNNVSGGLATDSQIVIELTAVVVNVLQNQEADIINNQATLSVLADLDNGGVADDVLTITSDVDVELVEATLTVTETITSIPLNPGEGDTVGYEIVVTNTSDVDSFEMLFSNIMPPELAVTLGTFTAIRDSDGADVTAFFVVTPTGVVHVPGGQLDLEAGDFVTINYDTVIQPGVTDGQNIVNQVDIEWTSLQGPNADERTGDGDFNATDTLDDYDDQAQTVFTAAVNSAYNFTKEILSTTAVHTSLADGTDVSITDLVVGESVTYRLTVELAGGQTDAVTVSDLIDFANGLLDIRNVSVTVGSNLTIGGSTTGAITDSNADTINDQVLFNFGTVMNSAVSTVSDDSKIFIDITAVVVDVIENQDGDVINNAATLDLIADPLGTPTPMNFAADVDVEIVEPTLTVVETITSIPANPGIGDTVAYEVVIDNSGGIDAFDGTLTNILPPELALQPGTFTAIRDSDGADVSALFTVTPSGVVSIGAGFDLEDGDFITINYDTEIQSSVVNGQVLTNDVDIEWTSIDGPNADERLGDEIPGSASDPVDDYESADSTNFTASVGSAYGFMKEIIATSETHTDATGGTVATMEDLVIGEEVTYRLTVDTAAGLADGVTVTDILDLTNGILDLRTVSIVSVGSNLTTTGAGVGSPVTIFNVGGNGNSFSIDFGTVVNSGVSSSADDSRIIIELTAVVIDVIENQDGDVINNAATLNLNADTTGNGTGDTLMVFSDDVDIEIVEPTLTVAETIVSIPPSPGIGDDVGYQIVIDNSSGVDSFDGTLSNVLPPELLLQTGTFTAIRDSDGADVSALFTVTSGGVVSVAGGFDLADGDFITINYDAEIQPGVVNGQPLTNPVDIEWTSIDGANPDERLGDEIPGSASDPVDDYEADDSTVFTVDTVPDYDFTKTILSTSAVHTGASGGTDPSIEDLVIGETVTYRLAVTLGVGQADQVTVSDILDLANGILDIRNVSLTVGANLTLTTPTPVITDSNSDSYDDQVLINFGTVTNSGASTVADASRIYIDITAMVVNIQANQQEDVINNTGNLTLLADTDGDGNIDDQVNISDNVEVEIVEPLIDVVKSVSNPTPQLGDVITYTLLVTNSVEAATSDAFDLNIIDTLPAGLIMVPGSVTLNILGSPANPSSILSNNSNATGAVVLLDRLDEGESVEIVYNVIVTSNVSFIGTTLINNVAITHTSLPDGASGITGEERGGTADVSDPNDYNADGSASVTLLPPDPSPPTPPPHGPQPEDEPLPPEEEPVSGLFFDLNQNFLFDRGSLRSPGDLWEEQLNIHLRDGDEERKAEPVQAGYIASGLAQPGTTVSLVVYNDKGDVIGTETVMADVGGNWMATFDSNKVGEIPAKVTVRQTPAGHNSGDDSGYDLRTYFAPASSTGTYYTEVLTPDNVMRKRRSDAVVNLYKAAGSPIRLSWNGASYEFSTVGGHLNGVGH